MICFCQHSSRLCALKIKVRGGKFGIISAYAPQSGRPFDERQSFFNDLADMHQSMSCNAGTIIAGDLNARLYDRAPGEEEFIGRTISKIQVSCRIHC
jgi:exonuclease III